MESSHSVIHQNNLKKCEKSFSSWFYLQVQLLSQFVAQVKMNARKNSKSSRTLKLKLAHVVQAAAVLIKVIVSARNVNAQFIVGLILVGIVYPLSDILYTFLPEGRVPQSEWYYESYYWLFLCIGPYIASICGWLGAMLLLIPTFNRKMYLFVPLIGVPFGKILWLVQVTSHDEYLQVPPLAYFTYGILIVAILPAIIDYLIWRDQHRERALIARFDGLSLISNSNNPVEAGWAKTWSDYKAKNF